MAATAAFPPAISAGFAAELLALIRQASLLSPPRFDALERFFLGPDRERVSLFLLERAEAEADRALMNWLLQPPQRRALPDEGREPLIALAYRAAQRPGDDLAVLWSVLHALDSSLEAEANTALYHRLLTGTRRDRALIQPLVDRIRQLDPPARRNRLLAGGLNAALLRLSADPAPELAIAKYLLSKGAILGYGGFNGGHQGFSWLCRRSWALGLEPRGTQARSMLKHFLQSVWELQHAKHQADDLNAGVFPLFPLACQSGNADAVHWFLTCRSPAEVVLPAAVCHKGLEDLCMTDGGPLEAQLRSVMLALARRLVRAVRPGAGLPAPPIQPADTAVLEPVVWACMEAGFPGRVLALTDRLGVLRVRPFAGPRGYWESLAVENFADVARLAEGSGAETPEAVQDWLRLQARRAQAQQESSALCAARGVAVADAHAPFVEACSAGLLADVAQYFCAAARDPACLGRGLRAACRGGWPNTVRWLLDLEDFALGDHATYGFTRGLLSLVIEACRGGSAEVALMVADLYEDDEDADYVIGTAVVQGSFVPTFAFVWAGFPVTSTALVDAAMGGDLALLRLLIHWAPEALGGPDADPASRYLLDLLFDADSDSEAPAAPAASRAECFEELYFRIGPAVLESLETGHLPRLVSEVEPDNPGDQALCQAIAHVRRWLLPDAARLREAAGAPAPDADAAQRALAEREAEVAAGRHGIRADVAAGEGGALAAFLRAEAFHSEHLGPRLAGAAEAVRALAPARLADRARELQADPFALDAHLRRRAAFEAALGPWGPLCDWIAGTLRQCWTSAVVRAVFARAARAAAARPAPPRKRPRRSHL